MAAILGKYQHLYVAVSLDPVRWDRVGVIFDAPRRHLAVEPALLYRATLRALLELS